MKDPTHVSMVSFPPFDGYMTKCCNSSWISSTDVEWTKEGLDIEITGCKCLVCGKENPEKIPYKEKKNVNKS